MLVYLNGKFLQLEEASISPFDRGFQFSDGVYEVIRYYPKKFFKMEAHLDRLKYSLNEMEISIPPLDNLEDVLHELISANNLTDELSIAYLQVTRGSQYPRRHSFNENLSVTFFISVEKYPAKTNDMVNGVRAGVEEDIRWMRCDIKSTSLIPNFLSSNRAIKNGLSEIIFHRNGIITEGTHTNVCFIKGDLFITPRLNNFILAGITRKVVLSLCSQLGIEIEERTVSTSELKDFNEIILLGTTTELTPVIEINGSLVSDGKPGPICRLFQEEFAKLYS
ncbi:MAG: aminotransferase class IV [Ignavibacteriales bacterium]|nr:aminotransferase class IV [Ignavibacteriales bacterium]